MNHLVKITENYDGEVPKEDQRWCYATNAFDTCRTLCGETLDAASHYRAEEKAVKRGGITCKQCLAVIKDIKSVRL